MTAEEMMKVMSPSVSKRNLKKDHRIWTVERISDFIQHMIRKERMHSEQDQKMRQRRRTFP